MNKDIDAQFLCKNCARYNLCQYYHGRKEDSYICKYFHLTETNRQEPRWVPVSERLPDLPQGKDEVLITIEDEDGDRDVYKGFYEDGLWWTQMYCGCNKIGIANPQSRVVAWMPLPEPYEEESEDT